MKGNAITSATIWVVLVVIWGQVSYPQVLRANGVSWTPKTAFKFTLWFETLAALIFVTLFVSTMVLAGSIVRDHGEPTSLLFMVVSRALAATVCMVAVDPDPHRTTRTWLGVLVAAEAPLAVLVGSTLFTKSNTTSWLGL